MDSMNYMSQGNYMSCMPMQNNFNTQKSISSSNMLKASPSSGSESNSTNCSDSNSKSRCRLNYGVEQFADKDHQFIRSFV